MNESLFHQATEMLSHEIIALQDDVELTYRPIEGGMEWSGAKDKRVVTISIQVQLGLYPSGSLRRTEELGLVEIFIVLSEADQSATFEAILRKKERPRFQIKEPSDQTVGGLYMGVAGKEIPFHDTFKIVKIWLA